MLTPGHETDRRIAFIIGDTTKHNWINCGGGVYSEGLYCNRCHEGFDSDELPNFDCVRPFSTDETAAFIAAEAFKLFDNRETGLLKADDGWHIYEPGWRSVSCESTPALAICAAIIDLRENT